MYGRMKTQNFGVEIELTGISRKNAAKVIAEYYGTRAQYAGTYYQTWTAKDRAGRTWKAKISVMYLPAYSPDLNPIEMMWSKVKSILRKMNICVKLKGIANMKEVWYNYDK